MKEIAEWFAGARWRATLAHALMALVMMLPALLIAQPWLGVLWVAAWFWSREKTQHEYRLKGDASTATVWSRGYWPGEWERASLREFLVPVGVAFVLALAVAQAGVTVADLMIGAAYAAQAATERTPFSYDWITYLWVFAVAAGGGFVSFIRKVKEGTTRAFNFTELIGELVTSAFAGLLTFWMCRWANVDELLSAIFIAITGHMGSRAIFVAERVAEKWFSSRVGVIITDTDAPKPVPDPAQKP
jgi:hypothetical protein